MAYPNAKVIGVEDTIKRMNEKSFPFDGRECWHFKSLDVNSHYTVSLGS